MSVCQTEEDGGVEEMSPTPSDRDASDQKAVSKVVRVLTVLAYLLSVSMAAILLSVYYIWMWKSPELPPINDTLVSARRTADRNSYDESHSALLGGSNTTVNETTTQSSLAGVGEGDWSSSASSEPPDPSAQPSVTPSLASAATEDFFAPTPHTNTTDSGDRNDTGSVT